MIPTFIRRNLAIRISFVVGGMMLTLMIAMGIYLTYLQREEHLKTMDSFLYSKARMASTLGAKSWSSYLETLIEDGVLTVTDVFDKDYQLIEGYEWGKLPKYHTKYDALCDKGMLLFQDKLLEDPDFVFAVGVDVNGYLPTHNTVYQQVLTGDEEKDKKGNRTKRIFDDPTGIQAARNTQEGFRQIYKRDTGETMWDVSSPIYVKGQHWGGFRIGVAMAQVEQRSAAMVRQIVAFFALLVLAVLALLFLQLNRSMRPVKELTKAADDMSSGESLDKPIQVERIDEIGMLGKSLERLRISMKAAMDRLEQ